jgi:2-amino-4-hydroxy-6-hydroxymethyldihydropteridine diphosphokinase
MAEAVLGLGSNLGARRSIFRAASALLGALPGCSVLARSSLYETPPLGPPQPDYLNAALRVRWDGDVEALLQATQAVEQQLGRERGEHWGARTLDIDVLHWSEGAVQRAHLEVPHRELASRSFALAPLLDVAPELAPMWGPVLHALKGAPPAAVPGWPSYRYDAGVCTSEWLFDTAELLAIAGELSLRGVGVRARAGSVRPFVGGSLGSPEAALAWLRETIETTLCDGFAVQSLAITGGHEHGWSGLFLGEHGSLPAPSTLPVAQLERREDGALRVRIRGDSPDDGLVSGGSATM